jgi:hypothetical protein
MHQPQLLFRVHAGKDVDGSNPLSQFRFLQLLPSEPVIISSPGLMPACRAMLLAVVG